MLFFKKYYKHMCILSVVGSHLSTTALTAFQAYVHMFMLPGIKFFVTYIYVDVVQCQ